MSNSTSLRTYTPQQQAFLDALFGEARGDLQKAKKIAGYANATNMRDILKVFDDDDLRKELASFLVLSSPQAVMKLNDVLKDPSAPGTSNRIAAANSLLDRAGLVKKDKLEVTTEAPTALLVLPPKASRDIPSRPSNDDDDGDTE